MFDRQDMRKVEEEISRMGRAKRKIVRIHIPDMGDEEFLDQEERSVVRNGVVEIQVTTHNRLLDCGHLCTVSSIIAACDLCGRLSCEKCIQLCNMCGFLVCRYCRRISVDKDRHERILCDVCRSAETRRRVARTVFRAITGFFVRREEG